MEAVGLLLKAGADVNLKTEVATALMIAEFNGYRNVVRSLKVAGAQNEQAKQETGER